ncbi:ComF family protein [Corynebacterium sp. NPDC060344]|uniref:ComF family protein n=1 Tax=Corynebacterium sp. NPDC060344 TaxID=3347101 RepID=UPI003663ADA0
MWGELADVAVPGACPGCGAPASPGSPCAGCRGEFARPPVRLSPRVHVPAPVWSCGAYAGPRRAVVLAAKERCDDSARHVMGAVVGAAVLRLAADGAVAHPSQSRVTLVPAPTRASAARRRGGDPVTAACRVAAGRIPGASVAAGLLRTAEGAEDSSGLTAAGRRRNIAGRIVPSGTAAGPVLLVDDVLTTGATAAHSVLVLASLGIRVGGVIVFSHA